MTTGTNLEGIRLSPMPQTKTDAVCRRVRVECEEAELPHVQDTRAGGEGGGGASQGTNPLRWVAPRR